MNQTFAKFLPSFIKTRIFGQSNSNKILSNTAWLSSQRLLHMGVSFFLSAWLARYLGPDQFGNLNYAIAFSSLFAVLSNLRGLNRLIIRDIVREPEKSNEILGTVFFIKMAGAILAVICAFGIVSIVRATDNLTICMVIILSFGTLFQPFDVIELWFQSQVQSKYTVHANNIVFLAVSIGKIALILFKAHLIAFAIILFCERIFLTLGKLLVFHKKKRYVKKLSYSSERANSLLKEGWPLILSTLATVIYMKIDQVMLGQIHGVKAVGIYSAASRISELWYFIPTALVTSSFPSIVEAREKNKELYYQRLKKLFSILCIISYLIAIPVMFISDYLMVFLFGSAFEASGMILSIHIWASIFVFLGVARGSWIISEGLTKFSLFATFAGAVGNVLLNLFLIPTYGGIGAAIATVISYAVSGYLSCFFYRKTISIGGIMTKSMLFPWRSFS